MHYYQFNIADYRKDTMHLSRVEHGIYRDLIDWYYLDEKPIPLETQSVSRRLRLVSEEEATALQNVLSDFFTLSDDGYRHTRIDAEIANYYATCEKNKENGKKGGRPKVIKPLNSKEDNPVGSQSVATGNPNETQINPNQEPITNNHKPVNNTSASPSGFAEFWSAYPKKKSKGAAEKVWKRIKPDLQTVLYAIERAKTSADWLKEQGQYIPHPATWLNAKGWEDEIVPVVASVDGSSKPWFLSSTGIQSKAESLGLSMQDGEVFPYFKQRVYQAAGVTPEMLRAAQSDFGARA